MCKKVLLKCVLLVFSSKRLVCPAWIGQDMLHYEGFSMIYSGLIPKTEITKNQWTFQLYFIRLKTKCTVWFQETLQEEKAKISDICLSSLIILILSINLPWYLSEGGFRKIQRDLSKSIMLLEGQQKIIKTSRQACGNHGNSSVNWDLNQIHLCFEATKKTLVVKRNCRHF